MTATGPAGGAAQPASSMLRALMWTGRALSRASRAVAIAPIFLYRKAISPALPRRCKYEPTCSRYAIDAIRAYGPARGLVLAGWRLLRCNPWSDGGYDPVEGQRLFGRGMHSHG